MDPAVDRFLNWLRNGSPEPGDDDADRWDEYPPPWPQHQALLVASVDSTNATFTVIPSTLGQRIRLWGWHLSNGASSDRNLLLRWDVSLTQIVRTYLVFQGGQSNFYLWGKSILGPYGEGLQCVASASGQTYATVFYTFEDRPEAVS